MAPSRAIALRARRTAKTFLERYRGAIVQDAAIARQWELSLAAARAGIGFVMVGSPQGWLGRLVLWLRERLARSQEHAHLDEDLEAYDRQVQVIAVNPDDPQHGRILHRGTTWDAESLDHPLVVGSQVRIIARDNLRWLVQPDPLAPLLANTALPHERPDHVNAENPDFATPSTAPNGRSPPKRDPSS